MDTNSKPAAPSLASMLGLDREPSDLARRTQPMGAHQTHSHQTSAARPWRVPEDSGRGQPLLPEIPFNAGRARYVAGDAPLAGPYSRRSDTDFGDLDNFSLSRFRPGGADLNPVLRAPVQVRAGGGAGGGVGGSVGARRTDWTAKYGR
jgi:hypothetical protein